MKKIILVVLTIAVILSVIIFGISLNRKENAKDNKDQNQYEVTDKKMKDNKITYEYEAFVPNFVSSDNQQYDFTMDMKYVNFPFKVKSSALKILTPKEKIYLKFVYEYLQYLNLHSEEHKRHYISTVQQLYIPNPDLDTQKNISQKLTCFDNLLLLETEKLNKLNALKKGLMQNMFV